MVAAPVTQLTIIVDCPASQSSNNRCSNWQKLLQRSEFSPVGCMSAVDQSLPTDSWARHSRAASQQQCNVGARAVLLCDY